jgi:cell division protein ZapA
MTGKAKALDVSIMGRSYKVACAEEEREALLQAVSYLDRKMNEIKVAGKVASLERIAVMAALNITHEMLSQKIGGFDAGELRRRMNSMQAMLDEALSKQDKLF